MVSMVMSAARRFDAASTRAHAVADLQADVPEHADQALERSPARPRSSSAAQQDQHVDVGTGIELAAPVAAGGDQRRGAGDAGIALHSVLHACGR